MRIITVAHENAASLPGSAVQAGDRLVAAADGAIDAGPPPAWLLWMLNIAPVANPAAPRALSEVWEGVDAGPARA
jgi:hypothetical protein